MEPAATKAPSNPLSPAASYPVKISLALCPRTDSVLLAQTTFIAAGFHCQFSLPDARHKSGTIN